MDPAAATSMSVRVERGALSVGVCVCVCVCVTVFPLLFLSSAPLAHFSHHDYVARPLFNRGHMEGV